VPHGPLVLVPAGRARTAFLQTHRAIDRRMGLIHDAGAIRPRESAVMAPEHIALPGPHTVQAAGGGAASARSSAS
jgi:hypothetical protein